MKLDILEVIENKDGSLSFEVDYDREFKKEFERKYKKRLTKKSLTEHFIKAVEADFKQIIKKNTINENNN